MFEVTSDGSWTLRLEAGAEAMHSAHGAFAESLLVYGRTMEETIARGWEPRILSVGLGLGYAELLAAGFALRAGVAQALTGESLESLDILRERFQDWLFSTPDVAFAKAYDDALARTAGALGVGSEQIRATLAAAIREGRWILRGPLSDSTEFTRPFRCVCYDAFSSKTAPELWTEAFLTSFLAKATGPCCLFSTYACTGPLKRGLKTAGFAVTVLPGFGGKRDRVRAVRESDRLEI